MNDVQKKYGRNQKSFNPTANFSIRLSGRVGAGHKAA